MPYFLGTRALRNWNSALSHWLLKARKHSTRAFSLIELVVVTAIIALITGLILVSDSAFGGQVLLENLAYDMALSIRAAQVYGISVQRFGNNFNVGYGVHFDMADAVHYYTFADALTVNGLYDCPTPGSSATCELVESTAIERGFRISKLCVTIGATEDCSKTKLDLLFIRPQPDAYISANGNSCTQTSSNCFDSARIQVMAPRGNVDSIVIYSNGQITVTKQ